MFPVPQHSAEKVQSDINTVLEAIARFLSKINLEIPPPEPKLPPKNIDAWLAEAEPFLDVEVIPDRVALAGRDQALLEGADPPLLEGRDPVAIVGSPVPPQLETEVRLQVESTSIIAQLPALKPQLEQLSPAQLATLAQAIDRPATETGEVLEGELIDIQINGVRCFYQEQGRVTVNALLPVLEEETVEVRPAHEVESLTGQALGDNSTLHQQVLHAAAPVEVRRDRYGHIKGGAAVRASVEVTEDAVEAEAEYWAEHPPLSPQAKAVLRELHDYFDRTGERELVGDNDYLIERLEGDRLRFTPYDRLDEAVVFEGDRLEANVSSGRYAHLLLQFAAAYKSLCAAEQVGDRELEVSR
jgi:hypothetical protein